MGGFGKVRPIVQSAPTARSLGIDRDRKTTAMLEGLSAGMELSWQSTCFANSRGYALCGTLFSQVAGSVRPTSRCS